LAGAEDLHPYPKVKVSPDMVKDRPDLKKYEGHELTVTAWLWTRTVASPNPVAREAHTPLTSTFLLSTKEKAQVWAELKITGKDHIFVLRSGQLSPDSMKKLEQGTRATKGQDFLCAFTNSPIRRDYIREQGKAGHLGQKLMAVVAEGERCRVYLSGADVVMPRMTDAEVARVADARKGFLASATPTRAMITGGVCSAYGLTTWGSLFTDRQILALLTLADLIDAARGMAISDQQRAGSVVGKPLESGGVDAVAYGDAIALYLAFVLSKVEDGGSVLCRWMTQRDSLFSTYSKHALPMVWNFAEVNTLADCTRSWSESLKWTVESVQGLTRGAACGVGVAYQESALTPEPGRRRQFVVFSTDPPYYDNIGYADLSDFFYVWLRRTLGAFFPHSCDTILAPKSDELIAVQYRHGSKEKAEAFFDRAMQSALGALMVQQHPGFPFTIYYAFKDAEGKDSEAIATGWEKFLQAAVDVGVAAVGTWPIRTERASRSISIGTNALASSIVLVCRRRPLDARSIGRRDFIRELDRALAPALADMTADPIAAIAPVDLAQAAIGPGMAIFSKYSAVLEADGSAMTVHTALIHINKAIDDYFAHAEGDMDADTRFCIGWFQQYGFDTGAFGEADVLARAKGTSVDGVRDAGVLSSAKGKVRLLRVKEYPKDWNPETDDRTPVWEACHQMCRALDEGEAAAGALLARMPDKPDAIRQLAYRLYTVCERKKWAEEARAYNELVTSWPEIVEASQKAVVSPVQPELPFR
jgi:putative DNA methylase